MGQDRSYQKRGVWGVATSCSQLIKGLLLDLGIVVALSTFDCHLVLMRGSKGLVLDGGQRGNFGEEDQNVQGGLWQRELIAYFAVGGHRGWSRPSW